MHKKIRHFILNDHNIMESPINDDIWAFSYFLPNELHKRFDYADQYFILAHSLHLIDVARVEHNVPCVRYWCDHRATPDVVFCSRAQCTIWSKNWNYDLTIIGATPKPLSHASSGREAPHKTHLCAGFCGTWSGHLLVVVLALGAVLQPCKWP